MSICAVTAGLIVCAGNDPFFAFLLIPAPPNTARAGVLYGLLLIVFCICGGSTMLVFTPATPFFYPFGFAFKVLITPVPPLNKLLIILLTPVGFTTM